METPKTKQPKPSTILASISAKKPQYDESQCVVCFVDEKQKTKNQSIKVTTSPNGRDKMVEAAKIRKDATSDLITKIY